QIYNLYIFDRHCTCVSFTNFDQKGQSGPAALGGGVTFGKPAAAAEAAPARPSKWEEDAKLVFGVVYSLRNLMSNLVQSGPDSPPAKVIGYKTSHYKLHYYETASGLKFVMMTDVNRETMTNELEFIYRQIYVEYVAKNPLIPFNAPSIVTEEFNDALWRYVKSL
ncbi:hypothetical protein CXG81DRAFT_9770, partial [Caulochytrium protostelioides]